MNKIPKIQEIWIRENFALSKRDFPTDFWSPKDLIEMLVNGLKFRGLDYNGEKTNFSEDCTKSISISVNNKLKFNNCIFPQFYYLMQECLDNEYYELLNNMNIIGKCFAKSVQDCNDLLISKEITRLLEDSKITL